MATGSESAGTEGRPAAARTQHAIRLAPRAADWPRVVIVDGASATGKSTAPWLLLQRLWERGVSAGFIDVAQLGFVHPGSHAALTAAHVAVLRDGFGDAGAEVVIVVTRDPDAVLDGPVAVLDADLGALADRVRRRGVGESELLDRGRIPRRPTRDAAQPARSGVRGGRTLTRVRRRRDRHVGATPEKTATALGTALGLP